MISCFLNLLRYLLSSCPFSFSAYKVISCYSVTRRELLEAPSQSFATFWQGSPSPAQSSVQRLKHPCCQPQSVGYGPWPHGDQAGKSPLPYLAPLQFPSWPEQQIPLSCRSWYQVLWEAQRWINTLSVSQHRERWIHLTCQNNTFDNLPLKK